MESFLKVVTETVNPLSNPVGVNLVDDAKLIEGKKIRVRDERLTVCQQIAYSRMYGWSTWCDSGTSHCVLGAASAGLIEPPERVVSGEVNCGVYQQDQASAADMQRLMPRLPVGTAGLLTYPLSRPIDGLSPDLVVIYMNTAQAMRMVQAFLYESGGEFTMKSSGDAGVCSRAVAQVAMLDEPTIEIPCMGDRRFALAQDHEMIVGIPASWLEKTANGLAATHKAGIRYPIPFQIPSSCHLPPTFVTGENDT
jgi:uncharacterized protein (DUF169 family)